MRKHSPIPEQHTDRLVNFLPWGQWRKCPGRFRCKHSHIPAHKEKKNQEKKNQGASSMGAMEEMSGKAIGRQLTNCVEATRNVR